MAKYKVCPECKGEGSVGPGWVWTEDDVAQEDPEEFAQLQAELRAGRWNVPCEMCKGKRVVTPQEEKEWEDLADLRHMERMERAFGC